MEGTARNDITIERIMEEVSVTWEEAQFVFDKTEESGKTVNLFVAQGVVAFFEDLLDPRFETIETLRFVDSFRSRDHWTLAIHDHWLECTRTSLDDPTMKFFFHGDGLIREALNLGLLGPWGSDSVATIEKAMMSILERGDLRRIFEGSVMGNA